MLKARQQALVPILEGAGLPFALLFGSAGRQQPFHDLDIGIGAPALDQLLQLGLALEKAAGLLPPPSNSKPAKVSRSL
ncbi:MAG: hypothetical protein KF760_23400 [Candidatus Eremiobacteraeota bacterium]|nr:hypothetical protein [Candidatus Eremiobacteraeota bacterium]MCW5866171.1 hypothetical protein [Candidatus Eremiobacteraeota bacterium]